MINFCKFKKLTYLCIKKQQTRFPSTFSPKRCYNIMRKNSTISLSDFDFDFAGYGHYRVTYTSPVTGKSWSKTINDMTIIDKTKNEDDPKRKDLEELKRMVKNN